MRKSSPQILSFEVTLRNRLYTLEYFIRQGEKATILFVHGLGGAKENFWDALKSSALNEYCIIAFDNPGTGNSSYYEDDPLNVDDLVEVTQQFIEGLRLKSFVLAGASMGGLITLNYLKRNPELVKGYINIEGNLMPEDCMFSSKVINHSLSDFKNHVFPQTIREMKIFGNPGYHAIATNLELNTNVTSYYHYSFQTVAYSSTEDLLKEFINLHIPRIFIYGDKNKNLTYIPQLNATRVRLKMIPESDHFVFYDNPGKLYSTIAHFISEL